MSNKQSSENAITITQAHTFYRKMLLQPQIINEKRIISLQKTLAFASTSESSIAAYMINISKKIIIIIANKASNHQHCQMSQVNNKIITNNNNNDKK